MDSESAIPDFGARYDRCAKLGVGGMSAVFRVFDTRVQKWRAAKVLPEGATPLVRKRFEDEARAMMGIRHRNVIRVHEVYVDGELPFFIMDLAEGGSLTDWVDAHGPMPPRMACDAAMQICKGVNAAHALGIVHRDIKPHNVLVSRRGLCKITDFGIARFTEGTGMTDTGSSFGTLGYMAPEQRANPPRVQAGVGPKIMPLSAVLVLGTAAVFTLGGAIHGSLGISAARTASIEADAEWRASVARNKPILEDLEILGAPQAKLQNIWNDQAGAPTLPISSLGALATANTPASRSSATISRLKSVDARLEILKVAGTSRDAALGAWVNATNSPTGRLSVMLGLAQPAPEK